MFPALPTGMKSMSGASPSWSHSSKAPVFWPSIRKGLTLLTRVTGCRSEMARTRESAASKLPLIGMTRAP
ncbi:hypothetical protein D3C86_2082380 [compost metagenome]